jgi:hypothetical protein
MRLTNILSKKNMNLMVGLLTIMVTLWVISYAIPSLFVQIFGTGLGKLILLGIVVLGGMANIKLGMGLLIMFIVLYRFAYMAREGMKGSRKDKDTKQKTK